MEDKLNELADNLTNSIMSFIYGDRFDNTDDITDDDELSEAYEYINEKCFGHIWAAYDKGYDEAIDDSFDKD